MSHHTAGDILRAAEPTEGGWRRLQLTLAEGDTADSGTSTKWAYAGPGTVEYLIHPSGWIVRPDDAVHRRYL